MARYFDITSLTNSIELDAQREGQAAFTVTNATPASIGGDALIVPRPGSEGIKFDIDRPTRHYPAGATESIAVSVSAPREVPAGSHGFQLRMVLSGGIPEEQFDDGPVVTFEVKEP